MSPALRLPASSTEEQWLYTREEIANSPSTRLGSMTVQEELYNRARAIKRLWILRTYQSVHQPVVSTAATFIHRFYMRESFKEYDPVIASVAAFFLACKVEEEPRSIKHLVQYLFELSKNSNARADRIGPPQSDAPKFQELRGKVLAYEEAMLRALCYDLTIRNPHWYAVSAAQQVWTAAETETGTRVAQAAWAFLNDALALPLCLIYRPQLLAGASILLACAQLDLALPPSPGSLAEQKALHEIAIQEAEEGEEPPPFVPKAGLLGLLEIRPEELREPSMAMLGGYTMARDPFVVDESNTLSNKVAAVLAELERGHSTLKAAKASNPPSTESAMAVDP
ncbi:hypothetical protein BMF94_0312 [Rhodotorula taiwanensis]|uniref:Cyclin-like domain-containing protein n=1 Tax=Rhodotorula taiwanensis TaxID=741276 RepID=A0A2S5BIY3_9BASI|nr:hypothetical protein BMF94_0312 [Rhodotorula taiwanensis]